jgi:hypothetical protein
LHLADLRRDGLRAVLIDLPPSPELRRDNGPAAPSWTVDQRTGQVGIDSSATSTE